MAILTFDLETENHESNKRKASPFDKRNYIVEAGWSWDGGERGSERYDEYHRDDIMVEQFDKLQKGDIINGFNIKFDLLWVWGQECVRNALRRGVTIYCGQYVEYLLGGHTQEVQMCSMNEIAEKYGGGCKIDAVKELWEAGYLTSEIPPDLLHDYLCGTDEIVGDVHNTWLILAGQIKRIRTEHPIECRTMIKMRMEGLLATIEAEYNGVYASKEVGEEDRAVIVEKLDVATKHLNTFIPELPPEFIFNWGSTQQKSALIFGGTVKYGKWKAHRDENNDFIYALMKESWPKFRGVPIEPTKVRKAGSLYFMEVPEEQEYDIERSGKFYQVQDRNKGGKNKGAGKFKEMSIPNTDKPKGAIQDHFFTFKGYTKPSTKWLGKATDAYDGPLYSTSAEVIEALANRRLPFTTALGQQAKLSKDLGTYYYTEDAKGKRKGMMTLIGEDGIVHHKLNHTSTVTSRLSSSDPNLQNIPRADRDKLTGEAKSKVKRMFCSRFGDEGRMAECDYSQLEVVIQGVLTRDPQLMQDLRDRVDFHCKRLAAKLKEDYQHVWHMCHEVEDPEYKMGRTNAKVFSFQRAYGAGVNTIVESTGMPKSEVEALVQAELLMYPEVEKFDKFLEREIKLNSVSSDRKLFINGVAFSQGESHWDSPTGTRYVWRQQIAPEFMQNRGTYTSYSPTERKNYPMQGFGGEVVQAMLGKVFRYLLANPEFDGKLLLVNTVHDCIWLDGLVDLINEQAPKIQVILESVPEVFNAAFPKLNIEVPFPCETEVGMDMFDTTTLHEETHTHDRS